MLGSVPAPVKIPPSPSASQTNRAMAVAVASTGRTAEASGERRVAAGDDQHPTRTRRDR